MPIIELARRDQKNSCQQVPISSAVFLRLGDHTGETHQRYEKKRR